MNFSRIQQISAVSTEFTIYNLIIGRGWGIELYRHIGGPWMDSTFFNQEYNNRQ